MALWRAYIKILEKKWAWLIFVSTLLLSVFFVHHALKTETINALENLLPEHDPDLVRYQNFIKDYGGDFLAIVVLENTGAEESILTPKNLNFLDKLTQHAEEIDGVLNVRSLANARDFFNEDGNLEIKKFYQNEQITKPGYIEEIKQDILANPIIQQYLVAKNQNALAVFIQLDANVSLIEQQVLRDRLISKIKIFISEQIAQNKLTLKPRYAGRVGIEYELDKSTKDNQLYTSIIIGVVIAICFWFIFKSFTGLLLTMGTIGLTYFWTMGIIHITGKPLNFMTAFLPPLILIVAVLDCIHVFAIFRAQESTRNLRERLEKTLHLVLKPCLLTSFTTAIGFGSLTLSDMQAVRHFGLFATFGIFVALYLGVVFLPAALALFWREKPHKKNLHPILTNLNEKLIHFQSRRKPWRVVLTFGLVTLGFLYAFQKIYIETKPIAYYDEDHQVPQDFLFIDKAFGGSTTMDLVITGEDQAFLDPQNLKVIDHLKELSKDIRGTSEPLSIINYLKRLRMKLNNDDPKFHALPTDKKELRELFFLLENEEGVEDYIDTFNFAKARVTFRTEALGSLQGKILLDEFYKILKENIHPPLKAQVVGSNVVWMNMESYVVASLIKSFGLTIFLVTLILCFLLRSVKWGLISMIPNLFPIITTFGLMGWLDFPLNMITLMIASIGISIAVDDTIHLMVHIRRHYHKGQSMNEAIKVSLGQVGLAIMTTSFLLACGFWSITIDEFVPTRHFGFLTGVTILIALIGDLILLPAVLRLFKKWL